MREEAEVKEGGEEGSANETGVGGKRIEERT